MVGLLVNPTTVYAELSLENNRTAFTFDDILLLPQVSEIESRTDCSLRSRLVGDIFLDTPFVAANMDTITDHRMMTAMANLGALAVLHRYMTVEEGLEQISLHLKLRNAFSYPVAYSVGVDDLERFHAYEYKISDYQESIGVEIPSIVFFDVAHGAGAGARRTMQKLSEEIIKRNRKCYLIGGNVCTAQTARELVYCGVDGIKVGVGGGSICTTRIVSGCGMPQLSAIQDVVGFLRPQRAIIDTFKKSRSGHPITIMADGGIRNSGDIVKAFWAGTDTVMLGSLLAGTDETPGVLLSGGFKRYDGMASKHPSGKKRTAEGVEATVPVKGRVSNVIEDLIGGVQSGMAYTNSRVITDLVGSPFVFVTQNSVAESRPHVNGSIVYKTKF